MIAKAHEETSIKLSLIKDGLDANAVLEELIRRKLESPEARKALH